MLGKDGEDMSWEADAPDLPALLIGGKGPSLAARRSTAGHRFAL